MSFEYTTYKRTNGRGPDYGCHCTENGKSRLIFFGDTQADAEKKATDWINANFDTPERREMIRRRSEAATRTKALKAENRA